MTRTSLADPAVGKLLGELRLYGQPVSAEAADLMADRRRTRTRADRWFLAGIVVVVLLIGVGLRADGRRSTAMACVVAMAVALSLAMLLRQRAVRSGDQVLGRRLPRRFSRAESVPIRTVLGRAPWVFAATVLLHALLAAVLFTRGDGAGGPVFVLLCVASYLVAALAVLQVVNRPVLAVDSLTLTVDDRLRSHDAARACVPAIFTASTFPVVLGPSVDPGTWAIFAAYLAPSLLQVALSLAVDPARWNKVGRR